MLYELLDLLDSFGLTWLARRRVLRVAKGKVLEVGIGTGLSAKWFEGASLFGVDLSKAMLAAAKRRGAKVCVADATNLPFKDGTFDTVLLLFSLRVIGDQRRAIVEALRVGGEAMVLEYAPLPRAFERFGLMVYGSKPLDEHIFEGLDVQVEKVAGLFVLYKVRAPGPRLGLQERVRGKCPRPRRTTS